MTTNRRTPTRTITLAEAGQTSPLRLERQSPKALHQRVADQLRAAIVDGTLRLGTHLVETELAKQVGVSRGPIREALRTLEREGLVVTHPYRGTFVLDPSVEEIVALLLPLRQTVEQFAARTLLAGDHLTIAAELEVTIAQLRQGIQQGDVDAIAAADIAFHRAICHHAHHPLVAQLWNLIEPRLAIIFRAPYTSSEAGVARDKVVASHEAIVHAMRAGDSERLIALLGHHIADGMVRDARATQSPPGSLANSRAVQSDGTIHE